MGSENGREWEKPLHKLYLDTFWIARTPVTNVKYQLFVEATGHRQPIHWEEGQIRDGFEQHPVVNVNWGDVLAYCRWLSQVTGKTIALPSEAEWEKAARGVQAKREYPWGDAFEAGRANTQEAGIGRTNPVGSYLGGASPYGVLDMSGNVFEWTRSLWGSNYSKPDFGYPYVAGDGRENLDGWGLRVLRGGSWYSDKSWSGCAARNRSSPVSNHLFEYHGFRVVVSPFASGR
jgi:formylglycine-generating enzyme required for sulfatase activity